MEEFFENLFYSATFPAMDKWRRFPAASEPPLGVMRVFVRMECRLQQRYGLIELERLVERRRLEKLVSIVKRKIHVMGEQRLWSLLTTQLNVN